MMWHVILGYVAWLLVASGVTLALYGWDKRQARNGGRRIRERVLHGWAFAGGWPGAWAGQRLFRHKTRKVPFLRTTRLLSVLHCAGVAAIWWWVLRPWIGG